VATIAAARAPPHGGAVGRNRTAASLVCAMIGLRPFTLPCGRARGGGDRGHHALLWTPPPHMVVEHFAGDRSAVTIPFFVYNSPEEMPTARSTASFASKLIGAAAQLCRRRRPQPRWQFMIELLTYAKRKRPDFVLIAGTEHMVSAAAIGATGLFSPLAGVTPKLVRELYDSLSQGSSGRGA